MKLFITNKTFMELDTVSDGKEAHQSAYRELRRLILEEETIPLSLFVSNENGNKSYYFDFKKADHDKEIYQYEYSLMVIG